MNIRKEISSRYLEALNAVDAWQARWLSACDAMQQAADLLVHHVPLSVGRMAGYEPHLLAFADGQEQIAAVCRIAEALQPLASPKENLDGHTVWRFQGFSLHLVEV